MFPEVEPVPEICGVESEMYDPLAGYVVSGAFGAVVSMIKVIPFEALLSLLSVSFSVAVITYVPSDCEDELHDHVSPPVTEVVHSVTAPE